MSRETDAMQKAISALDYQKEVIDVLKETVEQYKGLLQQKEEINMYQAVLIEKQKLLIHRLEETRVLETQAVYKRSLN